MAARDSGQSNAPAAARPRGTAVPAPARHPLLSAALLLLAGLPSGFAALAGGLGTAVAVSTGEPLSASLAPIAVGAGGLAGIWGSETLRSRVGQHTRLAWAAAAVGIASFLIILLQLAGQVAPPPPPPGP